MMNVHHTTALAEAERTCNDGSMASQGAWVYRPRSIYAVRQSLKQIAVHSLASAEALSLAAEEPGKPRVVTG